MSKHLKRGLFERTNNKTEYLENLKETFDRVTYVGGTMGNYICCYCILQENHVRNWLAHSYPGNKKVNKLYLSTNTVLLTFCI